MLIHYPDLRKEKIKNSLSCTTKILSIENLPTFHPFPTYLQHTKLSISMVQKLQLSIMEILTNLIECLHFLFKTSEYSWCFKQTKQETKAILHTSVWRNQIKNTEDAGTDWHFCGTKPYKNSSKPKSVLKTTFFFFF